MSYSQTVKAWSAKRAKLRAVYLEDRFPDVVVLPYSLGRGAVSVGAPGLWPRVGRSPVRCWRWCLDRDMCRRIFLLGVTTLWKRSRFC